jgi:hypothetical protein
MRHSDTYLYKSSEPDKRAGMLTIVRREHSRQYDIGEGRKSSGIIHITYGKRGARVLIAPTSM